MDPVMILIIVSTYTPGPNNIMSSSSASKNGFYKTLPFMFGVLVGTFLVFILTGIFNVILFDNISIIVKYIGYIGAIYMAYLAYKIITTDVADMKSDIGTKNLFFKGILLTFVNPKVIVFGLTVTGLIVEWGINLFELIFLSMILAAFCFSAVIIWGAFGYFFMKFLSKYQKIFNIAMASLLLFSALLLIIDTI